ncbi:DUF4270 domain-containing protein [Flavobacterium sp.]|uniref:DUF4270 domain-containing protein n=1 Tax=Flavobacterium sp. TaxID=239 RepID=UPI0038D0DE19
MKFNFLFKSFISLFIIVLVISCDKDVNQLDTGIVGDAHFGMDVAYSNVTAYNQNLGPVQTNNLTINQFGYYNSPVFGKTTASFVSQISLAVENPTFYAPVIDSVYIYVPYFSTFVSTDSDTGDSSYTLDSLKGSGKIKLSVYESTKFLENLDPTTGFQQPQKYYSNQQPDFDANNGGFKLNNDNKNADPKITAVDYSQNNEFAFSNSQIKFYKNNADGTPGTTVVSERKAPGLFLNLDKNFFNNKILQAPAGKLFNNNVFKNYFRGLYFKVESAASSPNQGTLAMMNFTSGVVTIVYHDKVSATDTAAPVRKTLALNLSGNSVNLLNNDNTFPGYVTPNPTAGDRNLFLKGGDGSMAIIDLFDKTDVKGYDINGNLVNTPNGVSDELDDLRNPANGKQKWLINEANLTFFINKNAMANAIEPNRIFLYDLKNRRPLVDYYTDYTTTYINSKYNKLIFGGILSNESGKIVNAKVSERGTYYKVNITNHVRNLIKYGGAGVTKDSTNVRLGLVVSENINNALNYYLNSPFSSGTGSNLFQSKYIPMMTIANPLGTVLYGSNIPSGDPDYNKRLKLEIYYTKPD